MREANIIVISIESHCNVIDQICRVFVMIPYIFFSGASSIVKYCEQKGTKNSYAVKVMKKNVSKS